MSKKFDNTRGILFVNFIKKFFRDSSKISALDIGCRYGLLTFEMAKAFKKVIAIDIYESAIEKIKERAKNFDNIEIYKIDLLNSNFDDSSFDLIILEGVLEWVGLTNPSISPKEVQIQTLKECKRLLKNGGILYCGIENKLFPLYWLRDPHSYLPLTVILPRFLSKRIYARFNDNEYYGQNISTYWGYSKMFYKVFRNYNIMIPIPNYKYLYYLSSFNPKELRSKAKKALKIKYPKKSFTFIIKLTIFLSILHLTKITNNFIILCKKIK